MESSQLEFEQFLFEWDKYKLHYRLNEDQVATNLFFCCTDDVRQHIRTKQGMATNRFNWVEKDLIALIRDIVTSRVSPIVHIQEFMGMKQHADEKCQD